MQRACPILYCHLWPVWLHRVFPHYLTNSTTLEKKVIEYKMCVLILYRTFSETFLILRRIQQDIITNLQRSCQILRKLQFSWQISEKYSNIKFHENQSSGSQVVPFGRTDRQTDMTKLIVLFAIARMQLKTDQSTNQLSNSMKKSPSWKANSCSACQVILYILWNPKVQYIVHKGLYYYWEYTVQIIVDSQQGVGPSAEGLCRGLKTHFYKSIMLQNVT
jgi:hypothetical protein